MYHKKELLRSLWVAISWVYKSAGTGSDYSYPTYLPILPLVTTRAPSSRVYCSKDDDSFFRAGRCRVAG